jgi:hypothetical protein
MGYIRQLFDPINCYQEIQFFSKRQKLVVATLVWGYLSSGFNHIADLADMAIHICVNMNKCKD